MTNCSNCWTGLDCADCPYRIDQGVEPKLDGVKIVNSFTKIYILLVILMIVLGG
jgi:hypothetical protein